MRVRQMAEITDFSLYVTTAFDPLLASAITSVRGVQVETLAYAPNRPVDLPKDWRESRRPHVYHLLGRSTSEPIPWAITEEDRLEFFHGLQSPARQPERLFLELREKHLLLVGGSYPDWLRVFSSAASKAIAVFQIRA